MVCSSIADVERPNNHHELCADGAKHRACGDSRRDCTVMKKRVNYPAIKHKEMVSGVYSSRLMVPAGV